MDEMYMTGRFIDPGRALDYELRSMGREELEEELVETREIMEIFRCYNGAVEKILKAKNNNEPLVLKSWIAELEIPKVKCDYNGDEVSLFRELQKNLVNLAKMLGYTREDANAFYREVD